MGKAHMPLSPRLLSLSKPGFAATVTLTLRHGVWFVTAASGDLQLADFANLKHGWGDTDIAVERCARRLGLTVSEGAAP